MPHGSDAKYVLKHTPSTDSATVEFTIGERTWVFKYASGLGDAWSRDLAALTAACKTPVK